MTQRVFQGKDVSLYPWVLTESEKEYVREFNGKKYINKSQNRSSKQFWDLLCLIVCLPFKEVRNKFLEAATPGEPLMMSAW